MKNIIFILIIMITNIAQGANYYVNFCRDNKTWEQVSMNYAMRLTSETSFLLMTNNLQKNADTIKTKLTKVTAMKDILYNSLVKINNEMDNGLIMKAIYKDFNNVLYEIKEYGKIVKKYPLYAPKAQEQTLFTINLSNSIINDIKNLVKGGIDEGVIASQQERMQLLKEIQYKMALLRASLSLSRQIIEMASKYSLLANYSKIYDYAIKDKSIIENIIMRAKNLI